MLIVFLIAALFVSCTKDTNTSLAQNSELEIEHIKTWGGSKNESAQAVTKTSDGGYAILGYTQSNDGDVRNKSNESYDYWLLKFDARNQLQWQKTYGGSDDDRGFDLIQTSDGGFAMLGKSKSNDLDVSKNSGFDDFWVSKLDSNGSISWEYSYGFAGSDTPNSIIQTQDNGYIIIGSSDSNDVDISNSKGGYDFWVVKISNTGSLVWEKTFGGSEIDEARAITSSNDGNYLIVGDTRSDDLNISQNAGAADLWLIKITPEGTLLWEKTIGGTNFDVGRSVSKTQDNGFLISGSSRSSDGNITTNKGLNDAWVLKIDSGGNIKWHKSIGGSETDFFYDSVELNDQTIVAVGNSNSSNEDINENKGFTDLLILKLK